MKMMIIAFSILGLLLLAFIIGKINLSIKFRKQVKELFTLSKNISNKHFYKSQLDNLPKPVKLYFNHILKEGQPFISYARITTTANSGLATMWADGGTSTVVQFPSSVIGRHVTGQHLW
jgi:hypothetical protein